MQSTYRIFPFVRSAAIAALALCAFPAAAQTYYFPDNTTINYTVGGDAFVGYSQSYALSSPTVNLVSGGDIGGDLEGYNSSIVNVSGGTVDDLLWTFSTSTVNVSSGSVSSYLYVTQSSNANVSGGTFGQYQGVNFVDATTGSFNFTDSGLTAIQDYTDPTPLGGTDYKLAGRLQNGQSVTGDVVEVTSGAKMFTFNSSVAAPKPSQISLLGLVTLGIAVLLLKAHKRVE